MKKILGLDLGVTSIGWALVKEHENSKEIIGLGSRIIPLSVDDKDEFSSGNKISKNQKRTAKRTQRKGYDRYQMRRKNLTQVLLNNKMFDERLFKLKPLELWGLRAKSVNKEVSLTELGRVLYHLNQKRGYKSSRSDANLDKKDTEYVAEVKNRHQQLKDSNKTIGQHFFEELSKNEHYRIKQQVFPREAYIEEFEAICRQQQRHHPSIITNEFIDKLRNETIYYQRKLKSQKGLVGVCDFEGFYTKIKEGKEIFVGPKVAPKSSPLSQVCKLWESINTINIKNKQGEELIISLEKKNEIFNFLDNNEKLSQSDLFKILELKKEDGWYVNKQLSKGLQGNICKTQISNAVKDLNFNTELLKFELTVANSEREVHLVDRKTGEILETKDLLLIEAKIENQPLYKLWHTIYSIQDETECIKALINKFKIEKEVAEKLAKIDFTKYAFSNKSVKAMRKILPYLIQGYVYSDSCSFAGYNHSNSHTKDENLKRKLADQIAALPKNSLRQPIVEKILNQLINVVNAIIKEYGRPDEIRIELARELKQSREERNDAFASIGKRERENETIRKRLLDDYGIKATRNNIIKWRLFHEINNTESKVNANCIYCGKSFGITDALNGSSIDVEHIIPKALLFDDSQSNKTLTHRTCNESKGKKTAYDYMIGKTEAEFQLYIERIESLFKNKIIGKAKRDKLLMTEKKIPNDFIDRQLRETQYIARKSKEILEEVCYNVWSTSGNVTAHLRRIWGWDDVLMNLQLPKYKELGLTEIVEWETNDGQKHKKEVIMGWNKRDDHRHHAIDALTIACTQQGYIQRINRLSSQHNRDEMFSEVEKQSIQFKEKLNLLDKYLILQKPFSTKLVEDKAAEILVSFKAGKRVATCGTRKIKKEGKKQIVQKGIIVPRGALSEESVYGKIKIIEKNKPIKYLFENPDLILNSKIRSLVFERLKQFENDTKKALLSLKNEPVFLDKEKNKVLQHGTAYKEEIVIKYPLESIKAKDIEFIVDLKIKQLVKERLEKHNNKEKEAFKEPLYTDKLNSIQIKTVRMFTGLSAVEPVSKNKKGENIGFVKPANNHHIAIYVDKEGKKQEHVCSFWHAVERKKYGIPVIIKNTKEIWDIVLQNKNEFPNSFLEKLPKDDWQFELSLQQNEMFVLGLKSEEFEKAKKEKDKSLINKFLFRIQKIGSCDYWFRSHTETQLIDFEEARISKRYYRCKSIGAFEKLNPHKIRVTNLGGIID